MVLIVGTGLGWIFRLGSGRLDRAGGELAVSAEEEAVRRKSQLRSGEATPAEGRLGRRERSVRQISADLQTRGVDVATAEMLSASLATQLERQGQQAYEPMLDGVALACRPHGDDAESAASRAGECQEIERLMGSFTAELNKLDEVLQVLAAHLSRMRTTATSDSERVVH